jgi:hypothetical protein
MSLTGNEFRGKISDFMGRRTRSEEWVWPIQFILVNTQFSNGVQVLAIPPGHYTLPFESQLKGWSAQSRNQLTCPAFKSNALDTSTVKFDGDT